MFPSDPRRQRSTVRSRRWLLCLSLWALSTACSAPSDSDDSSSDAQGQASQTTAPPSGPCGERFEPVALQLLRAGVNPGFYPQSVTTSDATTAYWKWRELVIESCSDTVLRIKNNQGETVSEGIAYGMLLAAINGDQSTLNGLWNFYTSHTNDNGVMHWKWSDCNTVTGQNAATDAELDAAMALIMADRKWGGYRDLAVGLITAIHDHELIQSDGMWILKPGDRFGGSSCVNPSYFAPAYYRWFAEYVPAQAADWNQLAADSYRILNNVAHPTTGLVPDWSAANGGPPGDCNSGTDYGYDAARTPWRIATDYLWWNVAEAKDYMDRVGAWAQGVGADNVVDGYTTSGQATGSNASTVFLGAFAVANMSQGQDAVDTWFAKLIEPRLCQITYYPGALRALYLATGSGAFAVEP